MLRVKSFFDDSKIKIVSANLIIDKKTEIAAHEIWIREQKKKSKNLFNGKILSALAISENEIKASIIDYKYYLAKTTKPRQFKSLNIIPIAVSGIIDSKDGFVFGKRSSLVTQNNHHWELVPSGSLDCTNLKKGTFIDFKKQIFIELKEEIGLAKNSITNSQTFCSIYDDQSSVLDIGIKLWCNLDSKSIHNSFLKIKTFEYDELKIIHRNQITDFLNSSSHKFVEVSRCLLEQYLKD